MVSNNFKSETRKASSDVIILHLLTFKHSSLPNDIKYTSNNETVTSNGEKFTPLPFKITLPKDSRTEPYKGKIIINNVRRDMIDVIMSVRQGLTCVIQVVMSNAPDDVEVEVEMKIRNIEVNQNDLSLQMEDSRDTDEQFKPKLGMSDLRGIR